CKYPLGPTIMGDIENPCPNRRGWRLSTVAPAVHLDRPLDNPVKTVKRPEQCTLAVSLDASDSKYLSPSHLEGDLVHRIATSTRAQVCNSQYGLPNLRPSLGNQLLDASTEHHLDQLGFANFTARHRADVRAVS